MIPCRLVRDAEGCALTHFLLTDSGTAFAKKRDHAWRTPLFYAATRAGLRALLDANATDVIAQHAARRDAVASRIVDVTALERVTCKDDPRPIMIIHQVRMRARAWRDAAPFLSWDRLAPIVAPLVCTTQYGDVTNHITDFAGGNSDKVRIFEHEANHLASVRRDVSARQSHAG